MVMVIFDAQYGRTEFGQRICPYKPYNDKEDKDDQTTNCEIEVTARIRNICHKQRFCEVYVGKKLLGRPCEGVYKYLKIIYACAIVPFPTANETSYLAVFIVAAFCAAVLFGIIFGRCWYLRRRTKSQNFAVLHKPKRFFDSPRDSKQLNGHVSRRASRDYVNEELLPERPPNKTELVITRADVENTQPNRPSRNEGDSRPKPGSGNPDEGDGGKGDNSTFYVNPMYDKNRQNSTGSAITSSQRVPATHRLSNASEGKAGSLGSPARSVGKQQQTRCNSMGNIPRSHHSSMQRRHPSAGNVAAKDGYDPLTYPPKGSHQPQQQSLLYNAPQIQPYQGQGNFQGQGQGNYQGQPRPMNQPPGTPGRQGPGHGGYPAKSPMSQRPGISGQPMGSPAKAPQRSRPMGPGGVPYPSPGPPARSGHRPNSPYEYGTTENTTGPIGDIDPNTGRRYHSSVTGEAPQWEVNPHGDRIEITVNPAPNSNGPMQYRSNGPLHRRESWENIKPLDNLPVAEPMGHGEHMSGGYGKGRAKPPLVSPLDSAPVASNSFRSNEGGRAQLYYPAPPDQGSDSSDDDLYSLVAKGNYDSVINDPLNVRQTFRSESKKHRNPVGSKHTAGRTTGRMFSDTSV
ncbi:hypothetical protein QZH41_011350 [Actinostola sp. cb2023]|nr:hypothetical protein QZH41_011350 [Actinostola sp. cb2023]